MKHISPVASLAHAFQIPMKPIVSWPQVARPLRQLQPLKQQISPFTSSATVFAKDKHQKIDQRISKSLLSHAIDFLCIPCIHATINPILTDR